MNYFKNTELAQRFHVSKATVSGWVKKAKTGKLGLELHIEGGRTYIANTTKNATLIEELVESGRKNRNGRAFKVIRPRPEFYKLYSEPQVYDICASLERLHEIPREYNYFDGGADNWDRYAQRLLTEDTPNNLNTTLKLLHQNRVYIDDLLAPYKRVNVIDVGVGNALPVRDVLGHLLEQGKLGRYIGIDVSAEMLEIARRNIKEWFDGRIEVEGYELDINREGFSTIIAGEAITPDASETVNFVLLLGGTIQNLREPERALKVIRDSMGVRDYLIHSQKLDTATSRRFFDFSAEAHSAALAPNHRFIFDLLSIDESFYDVEMGFDESSCQRYIKVRLKVALALEFDFDEGQRVIELNKGETILLWRAWQHTSFDVAGLLDDADFYTLQASQTEDEEYLLTISKLKRIVG